MQAAARIGQELVGEDALVDLSGGYESYCHRMSRNFRRTVKRQSSRIAAAGRVLVDGVHLRLQDADQVRTAFRSIRESWNSRSGWR